MRSRIFRRRARISKKFETRIARQVLPAPMLWSPFPRALEKGDHNMGAVLPHIVAAAKPQRQAIQHTSTSRARESGIQYYLPCEPIYRLSKTSYSHIFVVLRHLFSYYIIITSPFSYYFHTFCHITSPFRGYFHTFSILLNTYAIIFTVVPLSHPSYLQCVIAAIDKPRSNLGWVQNKIGSILAQIRGLDQKWLS